MLTFILQALVVIFSLLAGGFWTKSASIPLPNIVENLTLDGSGAFPDALSLQARWTKLSITRFSPAWSKATVSLLPSTARTTPAPNFWWNTLSPAE